MALLSGIAYLVVLGASSTDALLALSELHRRQGRVPDAEAALRRLDTSVELADAYERLDQPQVAVGVLENLANATGKLSYEARMRLARLYERTRQHGKAIEAWRSLWKDASTPAQRSLVESRLLTLAEEQGHLDTLTVDLEQQLARGRGNKQDAGLLVRLYTRASAKDSAIEVIQEYLSSSDGGLEGLKEQARVYRLVDDYDGFLSTQRKLMAADPVRRVDYLRGILLARIARGGSQLAADLPALIEELRAADRDGRSAGFEAALLATAGLQDEAASAYRRALVAAPAEGDNHLLLTELLGKQQRGAEAISMLQHLASSAANDEMFVVAADGVLNVVTPPEWKSADASARETLAWLQRIILEKLAHDGETSSVHRLLADIAQERGDGETTLAAVEASLAGAGALRTATLRELVTLTGAQDPDAAPTALDVSDPARHVAFGRRMVAIGDALPPEVYITLGKALLAERQPASAVRIFEQAESLSDRSNPLKQSAELFEQAGYSELALEHYARAVLGDRTDIDVLRKSARLQELSGQYDASHVSYSRALTTLMARQPPESTTREYRQHYAGLVSGYLMTWPQGADAQRRSIGSLRESLHSVPRPDLAAGLLQRVESATGIARGRVEAVPGAPVPDRLPSFEAALDAAQRTGSFDTVRSISLLTGDSRQQLAVARAWARSGAYQQAMKWADGRLDARDSLNLARYVLTLVRRDATTLDKLFDDGLGTFVPFLEQVEARTGQSPFSPEVLTRQMEDRVLVRGQMLYPPPLTYVVERADSAWTVDFIRRLASAKPGVESGRIALLAWEHLIRKPLPADAALRLAGLIEEMLGRDARLQSDRTNLHMTTASLMGARKGIDPANVPLARRLSDAWRERSAQRIDFAAPFLAMRAGDTEAAIDSFLAIAPAIAALDVEDVGNFHWQIFVPLRAAFLPRHGEAIRARLDEMEKATGLTAELTAVRDRLFFSDAPDAAGAIPFLERAVASHPEEGSYSARLYRAYEGEGRRIDALQMLRRLHDRDPGNPVYAAALSAELTKLDNPRRALALNASFPARVVADAARKMGSWVSVLPLPEPSEPPRTFAQEVYSIPARVLQATRAGDLPRARNLLRAYWHGGAAFDPAGSGLTFSTMLEQRTDDARRLFAVMSEQPFAVDEFAAYLRAVDPSEIDRVHRLYEDLAAAYRHAGRADAELVRLAQGVRDGSAGPHEFTLWLKLAEGAPAEQRREIASALDRRLEMRIALTQSQLLSVARLHALGGSMARAADAYRLLAAVALVLPKDAATSSQNTGVVTALEFVDEISRYLDTQHRKPVTHSVVTLLRPDRDLGDIALDSYAQFVMRVTGAPIEAERPGDVTVRWSAQTFLERANLEARAGRSTDALRWLSTAVTAPPSNYTFTSVFDGERYAIANAYTRMLGVKGESEQESIPETDRLFPAPGNAWPGAGAWMRDAAAALRDHLNGPLTQRSVALDMMAQIAQRLQEGGDANAAALVVLDISRALAADTAYTPRAISRILAMTHTMGRPVTLDAMEALLRDGRLEPALTAGVVRRAAAELSPAAALEIGERAACYTEADSLLAALTDVADAAGNRDRAAYWKDMRANVSKAREMRAD